MNYAINPKQLYQIVDKDAYLIDIRDSHQYNDLHIKNFINMTKEGFYQTLQSFLKDKPIYLICYQGIAAKEIVNNLRAMNYHAYYIDGGFQAFLNLTNTKYF